MRSDQEAAFADFVRATEARWIRQATRLSGSGHDAQDIVQHAWVQLYLKWPKVSARDDPARYMSRMVHNRFIDEWRKRGREVLPGALPDRPTDGDHAAEQAADDLLARAWLGLSAQERAVFSLRVFEELPFAEVVQALDGMSLRTVRRRYDDARAKLADFYTEAPDE